MIYMFLSNNPSSGDINSLDFSCCYKHKNVQEVLVNHLFKLAQENVWLGELTIPS